MNPLGRLAYSKLVILALVVAPLSAACGGGPSPLEATQVAQLPTDAPVATNTPVLETDKPVPSDTALPAEPPDLVATEVAVKRAAAATLTAEAPTPTSAPTDTPVPPTDTPAPPTDTPVPPTNTPPPITNTPKPTPKPKVGKILFTSNRVSWDDIFVMNDDGSDVKQLTKIGMCYNAHFSPDGKRIVFDHNGDIWAMNADGSGQRNLTNTSDTVEAFPVFASDGAQIAYLYAWSQGFQIYTMKADGSGQKAITSEGLDWMPAWQPGGNRIAFSSARSGLFNIWTVKSDGSGLKQVTTFNDFGAVSPVWSPDGKQIGMVRYAGNSWEIWAVNADGSNPRRVTQIVGGDDGFVPDMGGWKKGKFVFGAYHGNWDVASVPEMGGNTAFLSDNPKDDKPTDWWSP